MKTCCYIQARGGSKRIPGKNKYLWHGVPFVADAIIKAQSSKLFDLIMVNSDDTEILNIARQYGALPVLRSPKMSGDAVTDAELSTEIFKPLGRFDIICSLYPCVPLLKIHDLRRAYVRFMMSDDEALIAVDSNGVDAGAFYYYRMPLQAIDNVTYKDYTLEVAQDINTFDDIREAERKYEQTTN